MGNKHVGRDRWDTSQYTSSPHEGSLTSNQDLQWVRDKLDITIWHSFAGAHLNLMINAYWWSKTNQSLNVTRMPYSYTDWLLTGHSYRSTGINQISMYMDFNGHKWSPPRQKTFWDTIKTLLKTSPVRTAEKNHKIQASAIIIYQVQSSSPLYPTTPDWYYTELNTLIK